MAGTAILGVGSVEALIGAYFFKIYQGRFLACRQMANMAFQTG